MPYYNWTGIDLLGNDRYGKQFAGSLSDLELQLANRSIGLIRAKSSWFGSLISFFNRPSVDTQCNILEHLSLLIKAQVRLYDAFLLISRANSKNNYLSSAFLFYAETIKKGDSLISAFQIYPYLFDDITSTLLDIGEKTGSLEKILDYTVDYKISVNKLNSELKNKLLLPGLTLVFFVIIVALIFNLVVPQFENIFMGFGKPIPKSTANLFYVGHLFRDNIIKASILLVSLIVFFKALLKINLLKKSWQKICLKLPIVNNLILTFWRTHTLKAINILLLNNIQLDSALEITAKIIKNQVLQDDLRQITDKIKSGLQFCQILPNSKLFSDYNIEAYILVGESTGNLANSLGIAAEFYRKSLYRLLNRFIIFIQPALLIMLGAFIAGLLGSLYMSLLNLSSII